MASRAPRPKRDCRPRERQGFQTIRAPFSGVVAGRTVKLGRNLGNDIEVLAGVAANEVVVLAPNALLTAGTKVKAREMVAKK